MNDNEGFTIMEFVVVTMIVAIMVTLSIPRVTFVIEKTKMGEGMELLHAIRKAQLEHFYETGSYATTLAQLDTQFDLPKHFNALTDADIFDPTVDINQRMGTVIRNGNLYQLRIQLGGRISCNGDTAPATAPNECPTLGVQEGW